MGSYDTSETISRSSYDDNDNRGSSRTPARETTNYDSNVPMPNDSAQVQPEAGIDYERPTLVSLGGGLTPARIVKKVDTTFINKPTIDVIEYLISNDVAQTKEEKNIADAVRERMGRSDYRAIINDHYNFHNERLRTDPLKGYLVTKERETEGGKLKYNFSDIAIVTHEEGGKYAFTQSELENKLAE